METKSVTSKEYFKTLTMLHGAMLGGQILMAFVLFYFFDGGQLKLALDKNDPLQLIAPLLIFSIVPSAFLIFNMKIGKIRDTQDLKEKLAEYKSALIIRYAMIEGPVLLSLITYITSLNYLFILIACPLIVLFLFLRPTREKAIYDLELSASDTNLINNPDTIVGSVLHQ